MRHARGEAQIAAPPATDVEQRVCCGPLGTAAGPRRNTGSIRDAVARHRLLAAGEYGRRVDGPRVDMTAYSSGLLAVFCCARSFVRALV